MDRILYITSFALAAVSAVSGSLIPRKQPPPGWNFELLEDYQIYHHRYLHLGCEYKHGTHFFDTCCHPHLKNQTTDSHPSYCTPSNSPYSSAVAPSPSPSDGCDDDDHDGGPRVHPSTTLPFSSEIPPPSSIPAQKTTSPEMHGNTAYPSVVTPIKTTTSSSSPAHTPSSSPAHTPSPSPAPTYGGGFTGHGTYFYQRGKAGACGKTHSDDDLIAAIDQARYGNSGVDSDLCGKQVKITDVANGNTVVVTIQDDCPTCDDKNSLDLSVAAFKQLAPLEVGLLDIQWSFV